MSSSDLLIEDRDRVRLLTLNRPEKLNAWTYALGEQLADALDAGNDDDSVGAFVITGAGRGFCAGADIDATFDNDDSFAAHRRNRDPNDWVEQVRASKPIVAAVNGPAVGIGVTMIAPCDVIMAARSAVFAMAFIRMGLVPELASSHFLVARMGLGAASEMCLTGSKYSADEVQAMGLVDRVVDDASLVERAVELAARMAANPSPQLRWVKELLTVNGSETDLKAVQRRELERLDQARVSDEHKQAVANFLNKAKR